jgi:hypothetical protein
MVWGGEPLDENVLAPPAIESLRLIVSFWCFTAYTVPMRLVTELASIATLTCVVSAPGNMQHVRSRSLLPPVLEWPMMNVFAQSPTSEMLMELVPVALRLNVATKTDHCEPVNSTTTADTVMRNAEPVLVSVHVAVPSPLSVTVASSAQFVHVSPPFEFLIPLTTGTSFETLGVVTLTESVVAALAMVAVEPALL